MEIQVEVSLFLAHHLLITNLIVDLLKRLARRNLRKEKGGEQTEEVGSCEDAKSLLEANTVVVTVLGVSSGITRLRGVLEAEGAENSTSLTHGSRDTVSSASDGSREDLGRVDEGGRVRTPVGEEEGEAVHDDEASHAVVLPVVVETSKEGKEGSHEEESHELNLPAAQVLNGEDSHPVARNDRREGDDGLSACLEEGVVIGSHPASRSLAAVQSGSACLVAIEGDGELEVEQVRGSGGVAGHVEVANNVVRRELFPVHIGFGEPADSSVDIALEETVGVERNIEKEP